MRGVVVESDSRRGEKAKRAKRPRLSQERSQEREEPREHMAKIIGLYSREGEKAGGREGKPLTGLR